DPAARPTDAELERRLGVRDAPYAIRGVDAAFVGRHRELMLLREALPPPGAPAASVLVRGASGVARARSRASWRGASAKSARTRSCSPAGATSARPCR